MKNRDIVLIVILSVGAAAALFAIAAYLYIRRRRKKREDDEDGTSCAIRYKAEGFSFPSKDMQYRLSEESLEEAGLLPGDISYIEAHGTATRVGDAEEVAAIVNCYCKDRKTPILIGSVKSNIGHTEASSGLCSIVKVLLSMERGLIPGNLHYDAPNPDIPALTDGRLKVVSCNTPWTGRLASINCFGFGGSNGNVILESEPQVQINSRLDNSSNGLPKLHLRLIFASGRTDKAVRKLLGLARNHPHDVGLHSLIDSVHTKNIKGHIYRGYALIGNNNLYYEKVSMVNSIDQPRIWLNFSGDTDNWIINTSQLMQISSFALSIATSAEALKIYEIDLLNILGERKKASETVTAIVTQVALQIALVDVLRALEIDAEGAMGETIGNIGKSYADGSISAKQAILCAYLYGKYLDETHAKIESKESMKNILLNVNHGKKIDEFQNNCKDDEDEFDFVERIIKNVMNESSTKLKVPEGSVLIEVGVSLNINLLLSKTPLNKFICLLDNQEDDLSISLLQAIGSLYNAGANPQISNLYPPMTWPVPRGTPGLSSHVIWDHSTKWHVPHLSDMTMCSENRIEVDLANVSYSFLCGNEIGGKIVFPASGYLIFVWNVFVIQQRLHLEETPIAFEDVQFKSFVNMTRKKPTTFTVTILPKSGKFEVVADEVILTTGTIRVASSSEVEFEKYAVKNGHEDKIDLILNNEDIYKEFNLRGYNYNGLFKGIQTADLQVLSGEVSWNKSWIAFIDTIFQFVLLQMSTRDIYLPSQVKKILINPKCLINKSNNEVISHVMTHRNAAISEGIQIQDIKWAKQSEKYITESLPTLEKYVFCPYKSNNMNELHIKSLQDILKVYLQIAFENADAFNLKIVEVVTKTDSASILSSMQEVLHSEPKIKYNNIHITEYENKRSTDLQKKNIKVVRADPRKAIPEINCHLIVIENLTQHPDSRKLLSNIMKALSFTGMILLKEHRNIKDMAFFIEMLKEFGLVIICDFTQAQIDEQFILLRRYIEIPKHYKVIDVSDIENYIWVDKLRSALKDSEKDSRIYLVASDSYSGILGLTVCLRKEAGGHRIRSYFLPDLKETFSVNSPTFSEEVRKDLVMNVYKNRHWGWGSYRHLLLENYANSELSLDSKLSNVLRREESIAKPLSRKVLMDPHKCYIIIGGLGGFGLELALWLVLRGARKLVLNSRKGICTAYQSYFLQRLSQQGVEIIVATENAADATKSGAETLLKKANGLGPVGGIFNLAVELQDASLENQTPEKFKTVAESKVKGQVGIMTRNSNSEQASIMWGTRLQSVRSCLSILDTLLTQKNPVVASCIVDKKIEKVDKPQCLDLCKQVAGIFGITDLSKVSMTTSLKDLGMDSIMAAEVYHIINIDNDVQVNVDSVQTLTFDRIRKFEENK